MPKYKEEEVQRGIGDNYNTSLYEGALDQAVNFLDKLIGCVGMAQRNLDIAIKGKNAVIRTVAVADADKHLQEVDKYTESWSEVLKTMKQGKDVHIEKNCKSEKLDIVAGTEYQFGQYLVDQSNGKFCEENPDLSSGYPRGNIAGKAYIKKVTGVKHEV